MVSKADNLATGVKLSPGLTILLGMSLALFLGALIADLAYFQTFEIQWANFSAWLIVGGLLVGGFLLALVVVNFIRHRHGNSRPVLLLGLIAIMWAFGLVNALVHSRDGWAMMPTGLILSLLVTFLGFAAAVVGMRRPGRQEAR